MLGERIKAHESSRKFKKREKEYEREAKQASFFREIRQEDIEKGIEVIKDDR